MLVSVPISSLKSLNVMLRIFLPTYHEFQGISEGRFFVLRILDKTIHGFGQTLATLLERRLKFPTMKGFV